MVDAVLNTPRPPEAAWRASIRVGLALVLGNEGMLRDALSEGTLQTHRSDRMPAAAALQMRDETVDLSGLAAPEHLPTLARALRGIMAAQIEMGDVEGLLAALDRYDAAMADMSVRMRDPFEMDVFTFLSANGHPNRAISFAERYASNLGVALVAIAIALPSAT